MAEKPSIDKLIREIRRHYDVQGRAHLPWRKTRDPYRILVSEVMLQQTQVSRVIPFYRKFIRAFPTARSLARAPLPRVLMLWQGLGYNRRAKYLHQAATLIVREHRKFPRTLTEIEELPGVGHYTARAVAAFAFNKPEVFVETNIRTVFLYFCFPKRKKVSDKTLFPLVAQALARSRMEPRDFYAALMDYGAHLKQSGVKLNHRSAQYVPQSKFKGSARELRGTIVRELLRHKATLAALSHRIPRTKEQLAHTLAALAAEGLISIRGKYFSISEK